MHLGVIDVFRMTQQRRNSKQHSEGGYGTLPLSFPERKES
jgi:hypothetical protein